MQLNRIQNFAPTPSFYSPVPTGGYNPGIQGASPFGGGSMQVLSLLMNMMNSLAQLSAGWGGFGGQGGFGGYPGAFPQGQPIDYASQHFPNLQNYNPGGTGGTGGTTGTGYGGTGTGGGTGVGMPQPSDPREFQSYLQAQLAGGTLNGDTGIAQRDAIPGTRFGQVQDSTMWQASLARNYAYQFAAFANGSDALSAQGVTQGMNAFSKMKPEAQLFMQVASVFKGNLMGGPGFYDNPGLKRLLESKGLTQYLNDPQTGKTDVQSIGAIASAINDGNLTLNDVINSGTISDLNRYQNIINYVSSGGFAGDLRNYDTVAF